MPINGHLPLEDLVPFPEDSPGCFWFSEHPVAQVSHLCRSPPHDPDPFAHIDSLLSFFNWTGSSTWCLAVDLCFCLSPLLDEGSIMTLRVVIHLIIGKSCLGTLFTITTVAHSSLWSQFTQEIFSISSSQGSPWMSLLSYLCCQAVQGLCYISKYIKLQLSV